MSLGLGCSHVGGQAMMSCGFTSETMRANGFDALGSALLRKEAAWAAVRPSQSAVPPPSMAALWSEPASGGSQPLKR